MVFTILLSRKKYYILEKVNIDYIAGVTPCGNKSTVKCGSKCISRIPNALRGGCAVNARVSQDRSGDFTS